MTYIEFLKKPSYMDIYTYDLYLWQKKRLERKLKKETSVCKFLQNKVDRLYPDVPDDVIMKLNLSKRRIILFREQLGYFKRQLE